MVRFLLFVLLGFALFLEGCAPQNASSGNFSSNTNNQEISELRQRIQALEDSSRGSSKQDVEGLRNTVKRFYRQMDEVRAELNQSVNLSESSNERQLQSREKIENLTQRLSLLEKDIYDLKKQYADISTQKSSSSSDSSSASVNISAGSVASSTPPATLPISSESKKSSKNNEQIYRTALNEYNGEKYKEAIQGFQEYLGKSNGEEGRYERESFMYLGFANYEAGNYPEAKYYLTETLGKVGNSRDSQREKILLYLGYTHEKLKNYGVATNLYEQVVLTDGEFKEAAQKQLQGLKPQNR